MPTNSQSALRVEIESENAEMTTAWARGDVMAVSAFYANDGVLHGPKGNILRGRAAIDAFWKSLDRPKSWKLETWQVGGSQDDAYQLGRSTLVQGGTSADRVSVSEFVAVWKRGSDGRLRIVLDFYRF